MASDAALEELVARALNELAYAPHEASWAKDNWPTFLPHARAVLAVVVPVIREECARVADGFTHKHTGAREIAATIRALGEG